MEEKVFWLKAPGKDKWVGPCTRDAVVGAMKIGGFNNSAEWLKAGGGVTSENPNAVSVSEETCSVDTNSPLNIDTRPSRTNNAMRQEYMKDVPLGSLAAKAFPYSVDAQMRNEGELALGQRIPAFMNDAFTLGQRFLYPNDMGITTEEADGVIESMAKSKYLMPTLVLTMMTAGSDLPLMTAADLSMGINGYGAWLENHNTQPGYKKPMSDENAAALGFTLGAGGEASPYIGKIYNAVKSAFRKKFLKEASEKQINAVVSIIAKGERGGKLSSTEAENVHNFKPSETDYLLEHTSPRELDQILEENKDELLALSNAADGMVREPGGVVVPSVYLGGKKIANNLSKEEVSLLKPYAESEEQLADLISKAEEAKANGQSILSAIKDQIDNAQKQGVNAANAIDAETAVSVATKKNEESMLREMALGEADKARYSMKPQTEDIMRSESAVNSIESQIEKANTEIAELTEKVNERLNGSFNLVDGKKVFPNYVTNATEKIAALEKKIGELENLLKGEDIGTGLSEGSFFGNKNAYDAYLSSEYLTDAADVAAGEAKGLAEAGNAKKAGNYFANGTAAKEWQTMLDIDEIRLNGKLNKMRQSIEEAKTKVADLKQKMRDAMIDRKFNYANGQQKFVNDPNPFAQAAHTDKQTEQFFNDLDVAFDKATTRMEASPKDPYGNWRTKADAKSVYNVNEGAYDNRALQTINEMKSRIRNKERVANQGDKYKDPGIYNEDIVWAVKKLQAANEYEMIDALLDCVTWMDDSWKESVKRAAFLENKALAIKGGYNTKIGAQEKPNGVVDRILDKTPVIGTARGISRIANKEKNALSPAITRAYKSYKNIKDWGNIPWEYSSPLNNPNKPLGQQNTPLFMAGTKTAGSYPQVYRKREEKK